MDQNTINTTHQLKLPKHRLLQLADFIFSCSYEQAATKSADRENSIQVVCVADTHNLQLDLPAGDILVHAGDLTKWGTFDEIQRQLHWLSSQPHAHKLVIAGNHDVLFDEAFLRAHPEHSTENGGRTFRDLDFGTVTYLQDKSATVTLPNKGNRKLKIYGSPRTPQYGTSAFQYPGEQDIWKDSVSPGTDILISHGPLAGHLCGPRLHSGCMSLLQEIRRVRPKLVVCGHIHAARGQETICFDLKRNIYDDIRLGQRGWVSLPLLALATAWSLLKSLIRPRRLQETETQLVNAAVVNSMDKSKALPAFTVEI